MKQEVKDTGTKDELFTGGNWYIENKQAGCSIWSDVSTNGSYRTIVASIYPVNKEANAALLVSAPAMYRALKNNHEVLLRFYTSNMPQLHEEDLKDLRTTMADILSILQKATPNK